MCELLVTFKSFPDAQYTVLMWEKENEAGRHKIMCEKLLFIRTTDIQPSFDPARVFNFGDPIYRAASHFCCRKISSHFFLVLKN